MPSDSPNLASQKSRQRRVLVFMAGWTLFVVVALWWLFRVEGEQGGATSWVFHAGDSIHQSWTERARDWFRLVNFNFQRIYPWVLLGPYAAWLGARFALERGQLRLNVPVHLVACALFIIASHTINERATNRVARVVIITSQTNIEAHPDQGTNLVRIEISKTAADELGREEFRGRLTSQDVHLPNPPDFLYLRRGKSANAGLTNVPPELDKNFNPLRFPPELPTLRPLGILLDVLAYCAIVGLAHSVHFYRRYRERERRALFLESTLAKARLNALQTQLQPHFLFNSLNAIVTLLRRDPRLAEATLMSLSDLLRLTLSQSEKQEVTLREELQFVESYLEIQQTRFGDRLRFEQDIQPAALDCLVPTLLLQPLVENAIRHGIEPAEDAGLVRLTAREEEGRLVLTVEDDGVGFSGKSFDALKPEGGESLCGNSRGGEGEGVSRPALMKTSRSQPPVGKPAKGIGLANLRARLEALYGSSQKLALSARDKRGVSVRIEIPWHQVSSSPSDSLLRSL
jgi:signal transduction histidine kinase